MKKQMMWKTKGMNRDLSVSAFNPEFSFENMNLRLSTNEGNTMMSWVNEKGTAALKKEEIIPEYWSKDGEEDVYVDPQDDSWTYHAAETTYVDITLEGIPVGTAVLNHKLIVFFAGDYDYIYEFTIADKDSHKLNTKMLYKGHLNFDVQYPIETLTSYESKEVQKIYWTDFNNQPRIINIYNYEETAREFTGSIDTIFDFIPTVILDESVEISKINDGGGTFAPGVIQYCLSYYNKYAQQTNIVYVSPLYYLSHQDRGASPEERVGCVFKIKVSDVDENFEYIRLYSVQRTSIDATPIVKIVSDIKLNESLSDGYVEFVDNGTGGSEMDPTELLFIGGKPIKVLTMTEKDQTLFLGNIKQESLDISKLQDYFLDPTHLYPPSFEYAKQGSFESPNTFYPYKNSLGGNNSNEQITTFKGGEWYRFGIQLQRKTGEWSEPIFISDAQNRNYPNVSPMMSNNTYTLVQAQKSLPLSAIAESVGVSLDDYVKVRPLIVFPNIADRSVLCQGVLNPTVFNAEDRKTESPYAQASWFFRPYCLSSPSFPDLSTNAEFTHYYSLPDHGSIHCDMADSTFWKQARDVEIQGSKNLYNSPFEDAGSKSADSQYIVDQSIVTLNSPDIDFDTEVQRVGMDGLKLRIMGFIDVDSVASSHIITTSSNKLLAGHNLTFDDDQHVPTTEGKGELSTNVLYTISESRGKGSRMIAAPIWNDGCELDAGVENLTYAISSYDPYYPNGENYETEGDDPNQLTTHAWPINFFVHPWHASRSLNNDWRALSEQSSVLKTKRFANLLYAYKTCYLLYPISSDLGRKVFEDVNVKLHLQENEQVYKMMLPRQKDSAFNVSYYPNIDKTVASRERYYPFGETISDGYGYNLYNIDGTTIKTVVDSVDIKYKSTSHALITLNAFTEGTYAGYIPVMPALKIKRGASYTDIGNSLYTNRLNSSTFWRVSDMNFRQEYIQLDASDNKYDWDNKSPKLLWLGELYRETSESTRFGGKSKEAIRNNSWQIGGEPVELSHNSNTEIVWSQGDTYYQRYDCLKTYPFTKEDRNQVIEILSFMCETRVNIDGRYDANRGQINNVNVSPENFNLINEVYSQFNNFFTSKQVSSESVEQNYPNMITYSKTKSSTADVDLWTNVTLASTLELDGSKGEITSLNRFNGQVIAFQDRAISQILYNENVQVASTAGVPIEIANSGKVDGKRYLSDFIGCSNKWSIAHTPAGIYFMDSYNKGIYVFDGAIKNLSGGLGFNTWCKNNIPNGQNVWNPVSFNNYVSYYDMLNQEVLFVSKENCLAYSEKLGAFTSFYDYEYTPYFCNLDDVGIWIKTDEDTSNLWQHQAGDYCSFFGKTKPYWTTLVGNPEPQQDKIFTNLEFRASVEGDGELDSETGKFTPALPFDSLETWNEYQHGLAKLDIKNGHAAMKHHTLDNEASLKRKFRIWRCDIPRDNAPLSGDAALGVSRVKAHPIDRMRNPWLYLKLQKDADTDKKVEIHDIVMTYFT